MFCAMDRGESFGVQGEDDRVGAAGIPDSVVEKPLSVCCTALISGRDPGLLSSILLMRAHRGSGMPSGRVGTMRAWAAVT